MKDSLNEIFGRKLSREQEADRVSGLGAEIDRLRGELEDAKEEIRALRNALGGNHKLTIRNPLF